MPGVVFLIVVPTANFEQEILNELPPAIAGKLQKHPIGGNNNKNLNINLPEHNAVLRLEVELRDKNARRRPNYRQKGFATDRNQNMDPTKQVLPTTSNLNNYFVPMEKVLEELLMKLEIEHVTWSSDKNGCYHTVIFPLQAGEPCETTLHCLTELEIGTKPGSNVSVMPCSVNYDAIKEYVYEEEISDAEAVSKWNNFVESIKSKLTVKQVVDGVRSGGKLSFDYLLLILTADSLAALGLIENNAPNITAAMLVSPLMGPVMSVTFGVIISDRKLVKSGFIALGTGMLISLVFGFLFGLIVGATEQPWGLGDFPTEEMRGRGNARSLWMGIAWALTSGTGVALALLLGAAGPLIGVAISASLLPPVVNCGLFWALAAIWKIRKHENIKLPHVKGEPFTGNSSYVPFYTDDMPVEFVISGIVSGLLTIINVICIFCTAIIVLKIKEVAAPYTSSPDLRRFWETDIKAVRRSNRSTLRRGYGNDGIGSEKPTTLDNILENDEKNGENLGTALEQALKEATDDETFRKVKRMSYSSSAAEEITKRLRLSSNGKSINSPTASPSTIRNSKINADLNVLDQLVSTLLERQKQSPSSSGHSLNAHEPSKLSRMRSFSFRNRRSFKANPTSNELNMFTSNNNNNSNNNSNNNNNNNGFGQSAAAMPTILESGSGNAASRNASRKQSTSAFHSSSLDRRSGVRQIVDSIKNAPHRFSHSFDGRHRLNNEETNNLTKNMLD